MPTIVADLKMKSPLTISLGFDFKKLIAEISEETLLTSILLIGNLTIDYFLKSARIFTHSAPTGKRQLDMSLFQSCRAI